MILVDGRELLSDDPLDKLMDQLDEQTFIRVHRGAILNVGFVEELVKEGDRKYVAVLSDAARTRSRSAARSSTSSSRGWECRRSLYLTGSGSAGHSMKPWSSRYIVNAIHISVGNTTFSSAVLFHVHV